MKLRVVQVGEEGAAGTSYHIQGGFWIFWLTLEVVYSRFAAAGAMRKWADNFKLSKEKAKNRKTRKVIMEVET